MWGIYFEQRANFFSFKQFLGERSGGERNSLPPAPIIDKRFSPSSEARGRRRRRPGISSFPDTEIRKKGERKEKRIAKLEERGGAKKGEEKIRVSNLPKKRGGEKKRKKGTLFGFFSSFVFSLGISTTWKGGGRIVSFSFF